MKTIVFLSFIGVIFGACSDDQTVKKLVDSGLDTTILNDRGIDQVITTDLPAPRQSEKLDVLFVIDNSNSMADKQLQLQKSFATFIEGLRRYSVNANQNIVACTSSDPEQCDLPDLHIGVISTDLGAGNWGHAGCEVLNGDNGKLITNSCSPSRIADSWISYDPRSESTNITNIQGDNYEKIKTAFNCISDVGILGCGFEMPLESARRALDPALMVNPGFIRDDANLMLVFLTDEDDCSAEASSDLFDPTQTEMSDELGPLTSFRCFDFGVTCDINDRTVEGPRQSCQPAPSGKLFGLEDYLAFFKTLKPAGAISVGLIAGPTDKVNVSLSDSGKPYLEDSCSTNDTQSAVPAIRLEAFTKSFNHSISSICDLDYDTAVNSIAKLNP